MPLKIIKENNKFDITITKNLDDIRILRNAIGTWLEEIKINAFKIMSIKLCIEEAIYNGMLHPYKNAKPQEKVVHLIVKKVKNSIKMVVRDYGKEEWYKNYKIPDALNTEGAGQSGRGLIIMKNLSDKIKIVNSKNYGTKVCMTVNLPNTNNTIQEGF